MNSLKAYVIYSKLQRNLLSRFENNDDQCCYHYFPAVEPSFIDFIGAENLFDVNKANSILKRKLTADEIARTLSHIDCWKLILEDEKIDDNEFVIIAEPDITLSKNYYSAIKKHIDEFLLCAQYDVILLQRSDNDEFWNKLIYNGEGDIGTVVFNLGNCYDFAESQFYLIRKRFIRQFFIEYASVKPYWKATHFSHFCSLEKLAQTDQLLAIDNQKDLQNYHCGNSPRFSIIVPVYNVEKYLPQAIESVLSQNYYNYELILINDGSTDSSGNICFEYAQKYHNIVFIHKDNQGVSSARNQGIKIARGEYILFLDSDDYWKGNNILSELDEIISKEPTEFILSYLTSLFDGKRFESHLLSDNNLTGDFLSDIYELVSSGTYQGYPFIKILSREFILKNKLFFKEGILYEDVLWSFNLLKYVKNYTVYRSDYYIYRRERNGAIISYVSLDKVKDMFFIFQSCLEYILTVINKDNVYLAMRLFLIRFGDYIEICYGLLDCKDEILSEYKLFKLALDKLK